MTDSLPPPDRSPLAESARMDDLLPSRLWARLERMEWVSRKIFPGRMQGERRGPRKGQSVEFADFRPYAPGDDPRFVDWSLFARLDRLFLKLFREEEELTVYCLVDSSPSMAFGEPTKFAASARIAAALAFVAMCRGDRAHIEWLGASQRPSPQFRGRSQLPRLIEFVRSAEVGAPFALQDAIVRFCARVSGRGIVVLLSDLMDRAGYQDALRVLVARGMDICVLHMLADEELEPRLVGDLRLIDSEDLQSTEVSLDDELRRCYRGAVGEFIAGARQFCVPRGIRYTVARSDQRIEELVFGYLRQRGLMR